MEARITSLLRDDGPGWQRAELQNKALWIQVKWEDEEDQENLLALKNQNEE